MEFAYILNHAEGAHEKEHPNYLGLREACNELDRYIKKMGLREVVWVDFEPKPW